MNSISFGNLEALHQPSKRVKRVIYFLMTLTTIFVVFGTRRVMSCSSIFLCSPSFQPVSYHDSTYVKSTIGNKEYYLKQVKTVEERSRGLSFTKSLSKDEGMLFVFDNPGIYGFWMKDMNYPLDIVWLDAAKRVVHIEAELSPQTYPQSYFPSNAAQYVIELNAGETAKNSLKIGDIIRF